MTDDVINRLFVLEMISFFLARSRTTCPSSTVFEILDAHRIASISTVRKKMRSVLFFAVGIVLAHELLLCFRMMKTFPLFIQGQPSRRIRTANCSLSFSNR